MSYIFDYVFQRRYRTTGVNERDRYNVRKKIATGTFGVVYKARDRATLKLVAIKKAVKDDVNDQINEERDQYAVLGHHPNVTRLVGHYGEKCRGWRVPRQCTVIDPYITTTLDDIIEKATKRGRTLAPINIKSTMFQILRVANYLHRRGLIHQDLKPPNILVDSKSGRVVITDWAMLETAASATQVKSCTINYRPPESDLGKVPYSTAFDLWSIGAIMVKMYRGVELFDADGDDIFAQHCEVLGNPLVIDRPSIFPPHKDMILVPRKATIDAILNACHTPADAKALIKSMLRFNPAIRLRPMEAMSDGFFDELRTSLLHRQLFEFAPTEVAGVEQALLARVMPPQPSHAGTEHLPNVARS